MDQVESSPVGPEPGQGPGKIKDPTEACSPVVGNGRRTEPVLGRRGTAWHVVPPGTPSPVLGTRAHASNETNGTMRPEPAEVVAEHTGGAWAVLARRRGSLGRQSQTNQKHQLQVA